MLPCTSEYCKESQGDGKKARPIPELTWMKEMELFSYHKLLNDIQEHHLTATHIFPNTLIKKIQEVQVLRNQISNSIRYFAIKIIAIVVSMASIFQLVQLVLIRVWVLIFYSFFTNFTPTLDQMAPSADQIRN